MQYINHSLPRFEYCIGHLGVSRCTAIGEWVVEQGKTRNFVEDREVCRSIREASQKNGWCIHEVIAIPQFGPLGSSHRVFVVSADD